MSDVVAATAVDVCELWLSRISTALADCGAEPITDSYVAAGAVAWDTCCGLLVAAPERTYRSAAFPIEGTTDYQCESALLVVDIILLLLRCVPTVDDRGKAPSAAALSAAYQSLLNDAAVIWNVVTGELPEGWQRANVDQGYVGAQGGCVGVETRLSIGLAQDAWCPVCGPPVVATGATAGTPGTWTPAGASAPADYTALVLANITATPFTPWPVGTFVRLLDGTNAHWSGDAWEPGAAQPPIATGATEGAPGTWTPVGNAAPYNYTQLAASTIVATPLTEWHPGSHVRLQNGTHAYWDGDGWVPGDAPETAVHIWQAATPPWASGSNSSSYELGSVVRPERKIEIVGLRVHMSSAAAPVNGRQGHLWDYNSRGKLRTVTLPDNPWDGPLDVMFASPIVRQAPADLQDTSQWVVASMMVFGYVYADGAFNPPVGVLAPDSGARFPGAGWFSSGDPGNGRFTTAFDTFPDQDSPGNGWYGVDILYREAP